MNDQLDISDLSKAEVLAALYNASRPLGMGWLQFDPTPMTVSEAEQTIKEMGLSYEYLKGRVMKVSLRSDRFDPRLYDRDNGGGAAERAINTYRAINVYRESREAV